jgi:hypothetical protein
MNQHLSVRVPWHDCGWEGTVCCNPEQNQACRILKNIAKNKNDGIEINMAGKRVYEIDGYEIPCLSESGAFMSPKEVTIKVGHPYTYDKRFSHINKTHFSIESYTFLGIPFKWMLRKSDEGPSPHGRR